MASSIYDSGLKVALSLVGLVVCPLVSVLVYFMTMRRMRHADTLKSRAHLFYLIISGNLLAQFIGKNGAPIFVAIGFFFLHVCEELLRHWNTNVDYIGPGDYDAPDDIGLNRETMQLETVHVVDGATARSDEFAKISFERMDQAKDTNKRWCMMFVLLFLFTIIAFADGIDLIYKGPSAGIIICYYVTGITMSLSVYAAMIHAKIHTLEEQRHRIGWWILITWTWCTIFFCTTCIVVLVGMDQAWAASVLQKDVLVALYGIASGMLLKVAIYFYLYSKKGDQRRNRWDMVSGLFVFGIAMAQAIATNIFL